SKIMTTPVTMDTWIEQKKILSENKEYDTLELGFATFFLNRTNRSGILKAGVIGGKAQSGKWKLDVRYNKEELISRIKKIAKYKTRINLQNEDTLSLLKNLPSTADSRTLIYLDPPYYVKGQGLYRNFYNHQDHLDIQQQLEKTTNYHWLVTYDNAPEIKDMYANHNTVEFDLQYTAQAKKVGSEVMIYSDSLIVPTIDLGKQVA
ncbi:DNA adenine methylase, partial [Shewanella sp.]|uniref:DNA adenine methylase n=1 Tax=Shewanella sp. TaxID=50422 RepID=UPI000E9D2D48